MWRLPGTIFLSVTALAAAQNPGVQRLDPTLDTLVSATAPIETAAAGFGFTEGPSG
jgi:hypothetical protein